MQDKDFRTTCEFLSTEIIVCVLVYVHVDSLLVRGCHALCSIKCKRENTGGRKENEEGKVQND